MITTPLEVGTGIVTVLQVTKLTALPGVTARRDRVQFQAVLARHHILCLHSMPLPARPIQKVRPQNLGGAVTWSGAHEKEMAAQDSCRALPSV